MRLMAVIVLQILSQPTSISLCARKGTFARFHVQFDTARKTF